MSFILQTTKNGKDIIQYENNKYRESYSVKCGDIVWRCLGRSCKASIKTNKEKNIIFSSNGSHNGSHPVTMAALQTPTPPRRKGGLSPATPASVTAPFHTDAHSNTIDLDADTTPSLIQQANCSDHLSSSKPTSGDVEHTLQTENIALKEEIKKLRLEMQVILDHSIESDQRLLQFTDEVFMPPLSTSSSSSGCDGTQQVKEELERAQKKIQELEDKVMILSLPCELCVILKEESKNMIQSIRCLEAENHQLKNSGLESLQNKFVATPVHNSFQPLGYALNDAEVDFEPVKNKKRKRNKIKSDNSFKKSETNKIKKNKLVQDVYRSTQFSQVTILGDSHVRGLASLVGKRLKAGTAVSGMCKPGAGLLDITPISSSPRDHCYVLMVGTNDVDAGREDIIFTHLENLIVSLKKTSRVLVLPLTTRHDLNSNSPVHDTVRLVNNYIAELCNRHGGVEALDTSSIRRHHHTSHGLHLRENGKEVLANLIVKNLSFMKPLPRSQPKSTQAPTPLATELQAPFTLPYGSFAEAAARPASSQHAALLRQPTASETPSCPDARKSLSGRRKGGKNFLSPTVVEIT